MGWGGRSGTHIREGEPCTHIAASCSEQARAGMHLLFCVLCSVKAFWGQMGAVGASSGCLPGQEGFWECLAVSEGRKTWCWMQEAVFRAPGAGRSDSWASPTAPETLSAAPTPSAHLPPALRPSLGAEAALPATLAALPVWEFRH